MSNDQTPVRIPRFTRMTAMYPEAPVHARLLDRLRDPRGLAFARTAVGVTMLTKPGALPALLGVDRATRERMGWVVQMLGAREVALGVGALSARTEVRLWLAAGLLSDAVDALAVGAALRRGRVNAPTAAAMVGVAAGAAAIQADALRR
jgi:hypothetical protein